MRVRGELAVLIVCLSVGACASTGSSPDGATGTIAAATQPAPSAASATTSAAPIVGGDRPVTLRLPSPAPAGAMPLLLLLHGYGSSAAEQDAYMRLGQEAQRRGMAFAAPDGTRDANGARFWNGSDACCDLERSGVDDAGYLVSLIAEIGSVADIDPARIYLVGHSNGGFMSYRMACEHADLVAAIVSLAGVMPGRPADCRPSEPVTILQIHGTDDDVIRFDGGTLTDLVSSNGEVPRYPGARETTSAWARFDGCSPDLVRTTERVDIEATLFAASGPAETTIDVTETCAPGGHVELWTIPDGGHVPNLASTFAASVVDFLLAHPKP